MRKRRLPFVGQVTVAAGLAFAGTLGFAATGTSLSDLHTLLPTPNCMIKGNISMDTGERIYHVPGQEYYGATRIDVTAGERWFCSEAEALAAGWRRSKV
ncbi:MAG: hypothetical protein WDM94_06140 [Bauldia sp.]